MLMSLSSMNCWRHSKNIRLRSKLDIENVAEEFSCWQRYGRNLSESSSVGWGGGVDRAGESTASGNKYGWQWYEDPRLDCLGYRSIFPSDATPPLVEADKKTDESNYLLWRLEHGVAEGSAEIPKGEAIPLEYNFVGLNAISFDKGCYVGQELIARTHHRGVIRKRLVPLRFIDSNGKEVNQKIAAGAEVVESGTGKKIGAISTALGSRGMGVMRVEEGFKASTELIVNGSEDVKVEVIRPTWWPVEWFQQDQSGLTWGDPTTVVNRLFPTGPRHSTYSYHLRQPGWPTRVEPAGSVLDLVLNYL
ncbi:hypothetical protein Bca52824_071907 [Brassica carinata]|uniref:CAF17 C-terminal domain-containing protein n=1 Tax=Brassica carinata TaxID=52824 RepID=A0A8X7QB20_BRACI|nr:hypothetical protein Bca52824_071907 [Brassica carinata]